MRLFSLSVSGELAFVCPVTRFGAAVITAIIAPLSDVWTENIPVSPDTGIQNLEVRQVTSP